MGFDSIYQDWKEKGLFVKRLRIQHRKINPIGKASDGWLWILFSGTRIGNYVRSMAGFVCPPPWRVIHSQTLPCAKSLLFPSRQESPPDHGSCCAHDLDSCEC